MHKQKKISLNILLTACLLLASLWGGVILNAIKNRSTADATRWREFLYASQVDNREAYNYAYDDTTGWEYSYGSWTDNFANNISFTKLTSADDTNTYSVTEFDSKTGIGKVDISIAILKVKLYTQISESGLYYNDSAYISAYNLDTTTNPSSPTIKIGQDSYDATKLGGTTANPTYYIEYPVNELYAKYDTEDITPSADNNYGFKLYLDSACTIEYVGTGTANTSAPSSTPQTVTIEGNDYDIITQYVTLSSKKILLYTNQAYDKVTDLYYNNQKFLDLSGITPLLSTETDDSGATITSYDYTISYNGTSKTIGVYQSSNYSYASFWLNEAYVKDNKVYIDKALNIEYVGAGTKSDTQITYAGNAYSFNSGNVAIDSTTYSLNNATPSYIAFSSSKTIMLYTKENIASASMLYYNKQGFLDVTSYTKETVAGSDGWYVYYEGTNRDDAKNEMVLMPLSGKNFGYCNNYTIDKMYVSGDKVYLDSDCQIEYVGQGALNTTTSSYSISYAGSAYTIKSETSTDDGEITYDATPTYTFYDPNTSRMIWSNADTNVYMAKDVDSTENFAQNSSSNVVILDNYLNNLRAKANGSAPTSTMLNYSDYQNMNTRKTYNINNFYVSFGQPVEVDDFGYIVKDENGSSKILSALTVTAYLNNESVTGLENGAYISSEYGVRIEINNNTSQTGLKFDSNKGGYTNYYWYNYFDLTQINYILNNNTPVPLLNTYGLYTIVFDYTVSDYASNNIQNTKEQYVYQFYLTDDTNYVMYPTLNNNAQELEEYYADDETKYSTTYFNMSTYNLPTYLFDASKYNVTYSYTNTDNSTITYNTSFKLFERSGESTKLGLLTINSTSYIIKLDSENKKIWYYIGDESTTLSDDNLYGYIEIKVVNKDNVYDYTGLYLHLNGVAKYNDGMMVRRVAEGTPVSYYFPIVLNELGEYTFENKYLIEKDAYNFTVIEPYVYGEGENAVTVGFAKNIFKNYTYYNGKDYSHANVLSGLKYENGIYQFDYINNLGKITNTENNFSNSINNSKDGGYNLVFLGTKSTFMKNKVVTPFQNLANGIYGDITGNSTLLTSDFIQTAISTTTYNTFNGYASQIPITNLGPVGFNLYGGLVGSDSKIYYWKKNLTQSTGKNGYFISGDNLTICKEPDEQAFTNGTKLERAGLYIIKVVTNYQGLDSTKYKGATATQYFMFVIDNSDPEKYFWTGELDSEGNIPDENKLGMTTKYTNAEQLKFYWAEPNYFQESVSTVVRYSSSYNTSDFGAEMIYTKNSVISSSSGNSITTEGVYHVCIYYGQKPFFGDDDTNRSHSEAIIYVDRTAPTATFYKYTTTLINGEQLEEYSNTDTSLIGNGKFRLYSDQTKPSGADITVKYSEINFNTNTDIAELITIGEKKIVTTATYLDYVSDESISSQFYNLKSSTESIKNVEDNGQNLTLGSNLSSAPSKLYIFYITDEAGNSTTYYYIYDNSTPRAVYRQFVESELKVVNLDSTSVSDTTQVYWGDEKGILLNVKNDVVDESNPENNVSYSIINTAIEYINENSNLYKGLSHKADSKNYLTLPLSKANVEDSNSNIANTTSTTQITIVTRKEKDTYNTESNWNIDWKDENVEDPTISAFVSQNKTSYTTVVYDVLGNLSGNYLVYLDTDLANLTIFANEIKYQDDAKTKVDGSQGENSKAIKTNSVVIYYKKDVADGIEAYVTYSYYPMAMSSYFKSSSNTDIDDTVFNGIATIDKINGADKTFDITYPFSKTALYSNQVVNSGDYLMSYKDGETIMSQEGLYVLNRVYKYTDTNQELNASEVANLSENDVQKLNMYIVVDRSGIVELVTDMTGNVLSNESIGDLIYFTLGDGTGDEYEETISARALNVLQNANTTTKMFETNRVKVSTFIPYDKYATALKLNDSSLTKYTVSKNTDSIATATAQNNVLYKLYVSLLKANTTNKENITVTYTPLILDNNVTEAGEALINNLQSKQQTFVTEKSADDKYSLNQILSMVQTGQYRLYISDKEFDESNSQPDNFECELTQNNVTTYYSLNEYANSHYFDYDILHEAPKGQYTSNNAELVSNNFQYNSINKDTLSFEFEDNANIYKAKVDPNHFTVTRRIANSANDEVLLSRENGVYTTMPQDMDEEYIAQNVFIQSTLQNGLNHYTLNIFDTDKTLLSDRESDYVYCVTIYYVGEESFYDVTNQNVNGGYETKNYYSATYTIHQDTTAPSQNLNILKDIAREYAGDVDENNYFFAIDRENTGLYSNNDDESNQIYLRKIESLDDFRPSLLPGDNNFAGSTLNAPSFNPSSVDTDIYDLVWSYMYDENTSRCDIDFAGQDKGYYELLELDTAQNITRYFVYLDDNGSKLYANLNYNQKVNGSSSDSLNSVDYGNFDAKSFDINPTLNVATLNKIETFITDEDGKLLRDADEKVTTSSKDYYEIDDTTYYFDKFVIAYIKDVNGTTVKTIACDALNEKLSTFYTRVVEDFKDIQAQNTGSIYYIELLNRFGENYKAKLLLPDTELSLTITDKTDYFEVIVPEQSGNVFLTNFTPERANGGITEELSNDSFDTAIKKSDILGLNTATYRFGKGDYKFTIIDNYGRASVVYKFFGSDTDDIYTLNFGDSTITRTDKDLQQNITHTKHNVTLNINNSIWGIKCYVGENLNTLKENIENEVVATKNVDFEISGRTDTRGKYTYTFSKVGYYYVEITRTFAKQNSKDNEIFVFRIDRTLPKAYAVFDSGTQRELTNDSYSENITITWDSEYDITGTLEFIPSDGTGTTYSITTDMLDYYINVDGTYTLTLTDSISNTRTWIFEKIKSSYAYFTVRAEGIDRPLQESKYTQFEGKTIIQYYYVKYSGETRPEITILPDSSKGISSQETTNSTEYIKEYEILSSNTLSSDPEQHYTICIVRVVFVEETDDFARMKITEVVDKDGKNTSLEITQNSDYTYTSYAKKLELSFNSINIPDETNGNDEAYYGNTIYLLHYFNGELVKRYNGETSNDTIAFDITRSGLHRFEIRDICGNIQKWDGQDHFDLYVINSVIYTLNDENPIPNSFYNDEVKLSIIDKLDNNNPIYTYTATVLLNGKAIENFAFDANGEYVFTTPGYYTVTITATTQKSSELVETFNFTIINQNVAMIAFNIPTSYGFTIESIFKNQANMTDSITNKSTLWLSAGDEVFGSGVFTINASYFDNELDTSYYFSFKVWINEETPTILPVNYTYGTKTSKAITLQYNGAVIYSQIGLGYIRIINEKGNVVNEYAINEESTNEVMNLAINSTGEFIVALYNNEGKLVSSYKVIKTRPLNSSAKIIIIIVSCVVVALTVVFIFLRKRLKFR